MNRKQASNLLDAYTSLLQCDNQEDVCNLLREVILDSMCKNDTQVVTVPNVISNHPQDPKYPYVTWVGPTNDPRTTPYHAPYVPYSYSNSNSVSLG